MSTPTDTPTPEERPQTDASAVAESATVVTPEGPAEAIAAPDTAPEGEAAPSAEAASNSAAARQGPSPAEALKQLRDRFPALFGHPPKPLKLRIQADIQERAPGEFTKQVLSAVLRKHTNTTSYLISLTRSKQRYDLDGQPAGELSDEHRQVAEEELKRRRAITEERRAQEEQERRSRFQLLRDFEATTLTRQNFCALKGVAEDQLDGLLEQIRKEQAEWEAQRPVFAERRPGGPGPRRDGQRPPRREGAGGGGRGGRDAEGGQGRGPRRPRPER